MRTIMLVCLLSTGLLLPIAKVKSSGVSNLTHRIVDCYKEGYVLVATSEPADGTITKVEIFDFYNVLQLTESCSGYVCYVDLNSLHSGRYTAKVTTANTVYYEGFTMP